MGDANRVRVAFVNKRPLSWWQIGNPTAKSLDRPLDKFADRIAIREHRHGAAGVIVEDRFPAVDSQVGKYRGPKVVGA
jgi:hypothetical protein